MYGGGSQGIGEQMYNGGEGCECAQCQGSGCMCCRGTGVAIGGDTSGGARLSRRALRSRMR
jgi:hypothetical protein